MTLSRSIGASLALMTLGALVAVACNDSSVDACVGYCQRFVDCLDGGTSDLQAACLDGCDYRLDAGICTNATAGVNCLSSLSCPDLTSVVSTGGPSAAFLGCVATGGCDGGF